uniref:RING-type domain-containing protein n=1 Tax=Rhabditophanes sp. KR3021 TaxID=114890 RepID=A0AC35TGA0_9BILA
MPNFTAYLLEGNATDVEERKRLLCSIESCFFYALALIAVFLMWGFYQKTFKILTLEILWFIPSIVAYNKGFHLIILPWAAFTLSYLIYFHFVQRQTFKLANIMLWNKIQELCVFSGVLVFVVCLLYMNFLGSVEYIGQEGSLMGSIRKFGHEEGSIDWAIVIAILPFYLSILIKYSVEFMYRHMVKKTTFPDESGLLIHPDTCGICLGTTLGSCGNETKLFICDHEFHKACIDLWPPAELEQVIGTGLFHSIQKIAESDNLPSKKMGKIDAILSGLPDDKRERLPDPPFMKCFPKEVRSGGKRILLSKQGGSTREKFNNLQKYLNEFDDHGVECKLPLPREIDLIPHEDRVKLEEIEHDRNLTFMDKMDQAYKLLNSLPEAPPELRSIVGEELFKNICNIIEDHSLPSHKLKQIDSLLSSVPDSIRLKLPDAPILRCLPDSFRQKGRQILSDTSIPLDERFKNLQDYLNRLPQSKVKPHRLPLPSGIELLPLDQFNKLKEIEDSTMALTDKLDQAYLIIDSLAPDYKNVLGPPILE